MFSRDDAATTADLRPAQQSARLACGQCDRHTSAASGLCVIIITVCPKSLFDCRSMLRTTLELFESRLPVGSSASTMAGRLISARASATLCCSPPDSSFGRCSRRCAMPSMPVIFFRNSGSGFPPAMSDAISIFERALRVGRRLNFWNTNPILLLRRRVRSLSERVAKFTPSMVTLPESAWVSPPSI